VRKIEYAVGATGLFVRQLHRENFDRGMIASFGERFQVVQPLTASESRLENALNRVLKGTTDRYMRDREPNTRLYDSLEDVLKAFLRDAQPNRPKLLTVITDGQDNASAKYRNNPDMIGRFIHNAYSSEALNFMFVVGVGSDQQLDGRALARMGNAGRFPALKINAFPLLMQVFLEIAVEVSSSVEGRGRGEGRASWDAVSEVFRVAETPLDYAFLIDVSSSMNEPGDLSRAQIV
jgi:hypothetical protein